MNNDATLYSLQLRLVKEQTGDPADHDHEIEEARWMPLREAAIALSYEGERAVVVRAMSRRLADL